MDNMEGALHLFLWWLIWPFLMFINFPVGWALSPAYVIILIVELIILIIEGPVEETNYEVQSAEKNYNKDIETRDANAG